MAIQWKLIIVAALIMLATAFIWSGRYTISAQGPLVFIVDRFTGSVRVCTEEECTVPRDPWAVVKEEAVEPKEPNKQQWPGTPVLKTAPPPPPGFTLDKPAQAAAPPPPPPGFKIEAPPVSH
jgi:hypothetical protein